MAAELLIVAAIAAVAAYFVAQNPGMADKILFGRKIIFGIAGVIFALILIGTGSPGLVFVGGLALFIGFLWLWREEPHNDIL